MGAVYRALDVRLDRPVAVKVLVQVAGADEVRFHAEVRTLARLAHPNLVRLLDAGEADGRLYLVMELIEGETLAARLARGALGENETARIGAGVAAALAYVHAAGIIHRDVKPANILLDGDGRAHLADFGIARLVDTTGLTATGLALGTPAYLAPEQVQGGDVGPAADLYALGLVLIECLSGRRAFPGTVSEMTAARLVREPAIPPQLDAGWRNVLAAMTAVSPTARIDAPVAARELSDRERSPTAVSPAPIPTAAAAGSAGSNRDGTPTAPFGFPADQLASTKVRGTDGSGGGAEGASHRRLGVLVAAAVAVLVTAVVALDLAGVFSGATRPGTGAPLPGSAVGSVVDTTTTVSSTTTTTAPTTTVPATTTTSTATVASPVSTAAGGVVSAIETGEMDGAVTTDAGQQLIGQLQPMLFSVQPAPQEMDQFDQLVQTINLDVDNGEISGTATIGSLNSALGDLAAALGVTTSAPVTSLPGPSGGPGHGHGHGQGN